MKEILNNQKGRRGKTQSYEIQNRPLQVMVSKNGRPVSEKVARSFLKKHYPATEDWLISQTDHSTLATAYGW